MFAVQMSFLFKATLEDPRLLRLYMCLLQASCQRHFACALLHFLTGEKLPALARPESKVRCTSFNVPSKILRTALQRQLCCGLQKYEQKAYPWIAVMQQSWSAVSGDGQC